ncbi:hypothetical protein MASR1M107_28010 [Ignavibacteriales bacterium]
MELDYRRPKYYKTYDHDFSYKGRVDGVISWLQLPTLKDPNSSQYILMQLIATPTTMVPIPTVPTMR